MTTYQIFKKFLKSPFSQKIVTLRRWFKMLSTLPFYLGAINRPFTYLTSQPDSHSYFQSHPEFKELLKLFTKKNKYNNAGDITRLWSFILNIKQVLEQQIPGDFAELGVYKGNTASILAFYAAATNRHVYLFDTFDGFDAKDFKGPDGSQTKDFDDTSLDMARAVIGDHEQVCDFVKGHFPSTITATHKEKTFAIVSIDCDLYEPIKAGLEFFYPRMPKGGLLMLHDYSSLFWKGAKQAVDEFCKASGEFVVLLPDKSGSAFIRKSK